MRLRLVIPMFAAAVLAPAPFALAKSKSGFADKPGGGFNDPVIRVDVSVAPNLGARISLTEAEANSGYQFSTGVMHMQNQPPLLPENANGANQFIRIQFPFDISSKKVAKTIMVDSASTQGFSYLTPNVQITNQAGTHVPGIATINGKTAQGVKVSNDPNFPVWTDPQTGKNLLLGKKVFAYIATAGTDQSLATISAFGGGPTVPEGLNGIDDIRIRIGEVGKITINGFWVVKVDDGTGQPRNGGGTLELASIAAKTPVTPPKTVNGNPVVEANTRYIVTFSEPIVPQSLGFSAQAVEDYNASNPTIMQLYNGNSSFVPNPDNLLIPLFPNFTIVASQNNFQAGTPTFTAPFDVRPINPNNLSEYVVNPVLDMPGNVDVVLTPLTVNANVNFTNDLVNNPTTASAATSLYDVAFNSPIAEPFAFHTDAGRAFTNVPVSPQSIYFASLAGGGGGAINLSGTGFETNDPATDKLVLLTNMMQLCFCAGVQSPPGTYLLGCNPNTYGDPGSPVLDPMGNLIGVNKPTAAIGLGGNPAGGLGGPTPLPGINEGSTASINGGPPSSKPNGNSVFPFYPDGFETVCRNSGGDARLAKPPRVGAIGDMAVGDFLDTLFFDTLNLWADAGFHASAITGGPIQRNSISDPPAPNPPPLRLPVGLPPVDVVYSQQNLLKPAFVIEGDEVFTGANAITCQIPNAWCVIGGTGACARVLLVEQKPPLNPLGVGDAFPTWAQNGPAYQSFLAPVGFGARQQIGNFLYMTDRDQGVVQVVNSNNFSVIDQIPTPDPEGVTLAPNLKTVYVSNFRDDSVSFIGSDPLLPFFHEEISRINVGNGPTDIDAQPDGEDVLVANTLGNSVSILSPATQTVRKTLSASIKRPTAVVSTPRQTITGFFPLVYFAYIANSGDGSVVIYESGPGGATGFGTDDMRWQVQTTQPFTDMGGMVYDPGTPPGASAPLATGVFVAHTDPQTGLAMVTRCYFTGQLPQPGPFPPIPVPGTILNAPGVTQRNFTPVGTWGGPLVPLIQQMNPGGQDQTATDLVLADFDTSSIGFFAQPANQIAATPTNFGAFSTGVPAAGGQNSKSPLRFGSATVVPARMYASFAGDNRIVVMDVEAAGTVLNTINGVPVPGKLTTFFYD